jgi:hypothetical protein
MADYDESQQAIANGSGSAATASKTDLHLMSTAPNYPADLSITCVLHRWFTLIIGGGIAFGGETTCDSTMAALTGRATIVGGGQTVAFGNNATCNVCSHVKSTGTSSSLYTGFPYTYKYASSLQLTSGWRWTPPFPYGCTQTSYTVVTCLFTHDFTAE